MKKTINASLVTCMMTIKLSHYVLMLTIMRVYVKCYDGQNKWMYILIKDNDVLTNLHG